MAQEARLVIVIDSERAKRTAQDLSVELDSITKKGDFASKSMDRMSVATRALAGYMAGLLTVGSAISKMDTYTGLQNRLKLVTNNQVELNKATEDTFRIAQKTYSAWDSVLQVYQRFSDNAKTLNLTMDDTARLTETVSKAVAISGASAEAADAALVQFGQALASGTLRGEELNSVMEQTPALAKAIAQGMGITVGQLRSVAAEGKITSKEIVKALKNAQDDVDALFAKTDITIGQSLTLLNNEIIKFVGEAGKGSGAAQLLAGSVQTLASNLDLIADGALVVGIGYITRAILMKSAAVKEGMASTLASRQASVLNAQAEYAEATATLNAAKAHLANVRATNAETQAKFGATAAATRYAQAQAAVTAATNAQTAAQTRLSAASSLVGSIGSRALGLIGGPIGAITLGVSALAATYTYFKGKAEEANRTLAEQAEVANRTAEELKGLKGEAKTKAINDLTTAFKAQNEELKKTEMAVGSALIDIQNFGKGNVELTRISNEARLGTISYKEAMEQLAKQKLPPSLRDALQEQIDKYNEAYDKADKTKTAIKLFGIEVTLTGNKAQNAAIEQQKHAEAIKNTKQAADEAQKSLQKLYADKLWDTQFVEIVMKKGFSESQANDLLKLWKDSLAKGLKAVDQEALKSLVDTWKSEESIKAITDARTDSIREQNKESKKRLKITQAELEVAKRSAALIEASGLGKYAESKGIPSSVIAGLLAQESKGIRDAKSHTGAIGYFQTTSGYRKQNNMSVADSYDLEKSGKIAIDNIAKVYEKTGNLAQAILSHNAGEAGAEQFIKTGKVSGSKARNKEVSEYVGKVSRYSDIIAGGVGKGGLSEGDSDRAYGEQIKARLELIKQGLNLQDQYESEQAKRTKARNEEINLALQTGQANLIPKINERYDAEDKLAQKQFDFEVNGHEWTEEKKLEYTYETNSLRLVAEGKLTEEQRKIAIDSFKLQQQQELGLLKLAQEQRLFQAKISYMHEVDAMRERYRLEREEIKQTYRNKPEERDALLNASSRAEDNEFADKRKGAWNNYRRMQGEMDGTSEYVNLDINYEEQAKVLEDAKKYELITAEEHEAAMFKIKQDYKDKKLALDLEYGQQAMSSLTSIFGSMFGEQSKAYKVMFAADKAYAIAVAGIEIQKGISKAIGLGFPANIPVIAQVVAQGASIIANIRAIKDQGFADGGYTGRGGKYEVAGAVHKGEIVWSQEDIKRWGGVGLVEKMRKSANPEAFLNNNASADSVMRRAMMSSSAFIESQKQADIFNQPVQDTQIIYKGNRDTPKLTSSANSDLFHDGKVYFSSNGFVQDRSNLEDVQDFTMGQAARPQAEIMPSIEPASPTINFKIEVINQVSGATVEAEQLDEQTVRIIVKDELDKQLPRTVPKLVSDQIGNPNSTISRSLTENTTVRRNR
ncbi:tape measure protein [Acinetobacter baumannii]